MSTESKESIRASILGVDREVLCKVAPGPFSSEITVCIELPNGKVVSGFFNELYASWEGELNKNEEVEGRFGVRVIEDDDESALVEFTSNPGQHLMPNSSSRERVPKDFLLPQEEVADKDIRTN